MNSESQPLQLHEIHAMRADKAVINRVYGSYILMLSFYGITLLDFRTGLLSRSENYVSRYKNLCRSPHNYLRVTRILKSLSELGLEHLNAGLLLYFLWEQSENSQLNVSRLKSSMDRWWANCIRDEEERTMVNDLIGQVRSGELKFTREKYEAVLERRMKVTKARRKARREEQERQAQEREHGHGHEHQHGHGHGHEHRHGPERQYRPEHHYRQEHHFGQEHQYEGQERRRDERHHRQEHQYGQERHHRQEHQYAPEHQYGSDPPPYEQEYQHHGHQHPYAPEHQHGHEHQYAPEHQRGREHQHEQEHQHEHERQCEHGEEEAQGYMEEEEQDQVQEVGQGSALHQGHTMEQRHTTEQQPMEQPPVEENDIDISEEMTVDVAPKAMRRRKSKKLHRLGKDRRH
ncbi:hypothetical protein FRC15_003265 [Serendipita sp. 397]|nr:hypothetical protein FRC15_003265 [Serendipita sp. 397]